MEEEKNDEKGGSEEHTSKFNIDAVLICTADRTHREIVTALAPLGLHIMCEKLLATSLMDCLDIARSLGVGLQPGEQGRYAGLFAIGHVPLNRMIRKLVCEDDAIGDIVSIEHTENVGWWHFAPSYVRVSAFGSVTHFRRPQKPTAAGTATDCLSCPAEKNCHFSAQKIYTENSLKAGLPGWPVNVVVPEIEDLLRKGKVGLRRAEDILMKRLGEYYTSETPEDVVNQKQWYGRCVYEADNNVWDDQTVHIAWDDDPLPSQHPSSRRTAKSATFHMTAFGDGIGTIRTKIYGTKGELESNGRQVGVVDFRTGIADNLIPPLSLGDKREETIC
ncbi:hypothetical protein BDV12DRAFT_201625 [Aspergillus spectabilis]